MIRNVMMAVCSRCNTQVVWEKRKHHVCQMVRHENNVATMEPVAIIDAKDARIAELERENADIRLPRLHKDSLIQRLRERNEELERENERQIGYVNAGLEDYADAKCSVDRLSTALKIAREAIEKAPHVPMCDTNKFRSTFEPLPDDWPSDWHPDRFMPLETRIPLGLPCNCWKRDVLPKIDATSIVSPPQATP